MTRGVNVGLCSLAKEIAVNVEQVLKALGTSTDPDFPVVVMRKEGDKLLAAPALGVALDDGSDDVALLMGEFLEEDAALDGAVSIGEIGAALEELRALGADWPVFSTAMDDPTLGGSLVGFSVNDEVEIFAFLQGPKSDWDDA